MKYFLDVDQSSFSILDSLEDQVIGVSFCACRGKKKLDGFSFPVFRGASEPMLGSWNQTAEAAELDQIAGFLCSEEEVTYVCLSALTDPAELILFHPEVISHISRFIVSAGSLKNESDTLMQRRLSLDPVAAKSFFAWDLKRVLIPGGIGEEDSAVLSYLENPESFHAENSFVQVDLNGNGRDSVNLVIDMRRGWAAELRKNLPHTDVITKRILKES